MSSIAQTLAVLRVARLRQANLTTPSNAATILLEQTLQEGHAYHVRGRILGLATDMSGGVAYTFQGLCARDYGGGATLAGATDNPAVQESPSDSACALTTSVSGNAFRVNVTGLMLKPMRWIGVFEFLEIGVDNDA